MRSIQNDPSSPTPNAFDPFIAVVVSIVLVILFAVAIHFRPKPTQETATPGVTSNANSTL